MSSNGEIARLFRVKNRLVIHRVVDILYAKSYVAAVVGRYMLQGYQGVSGAAGVDEVTRRLDQREKNDASDEHADSLQATEGQRDRGTPSGGNSQ